MSKFSIRKQFFRKKIFRLINYCQTRVCISSNVSLFVEYDRPSCRSVMTMDIADIEQDDDDRILTKGMLLSIAYGSAVGGTATLTGTPPNLVLNGLLET